MKQRYCILLLCIIVSIVLYWYIHTDCILYIPHFLSDHEIQQLHKCIHSNSESKINHNGLLTKTLDRRMNDLFYTHDKLQQISDLTGVQVYPSKIPCEYRRYNQSQGMRWHKDVQLYTQPQYECVYTLSNTSDSTTDYIDEWGIKNKVWTEPNSLMIVKARGFNHGVNPVNQGVREIIKLIYTPTDKINPLKRREYFQALNGFT